MFSTGSVNYSIFDGPHIPETESQQLKTERMKKMEDEMIRFRYVRDEIRPLTFLEQTLSKDEDNFYFSLEANKEMQYFLIRDPNTHIVHFGDKNPNYNPEIDERISEAAGIYFFVWIESEKRFAEFWVDEYNYYEDGGTTDIKFRDARIENKNIMKWHIDSDSEMPFSSDLFGAVEIAPSNPYLIVGTSKKYDYKNLYSLDRDEKDHLKYLLELYLPDVCKKITSLSHSHTLHM